TPRSTSTTWAPRPRPCSAHRWSRALPPARSSSAPRERVGFSEAVNRDALRRIAANATSLFPFLRDVKVIRHYHGFRPYSPDHVPVLGPDPRADGLWHAGGHEGAGI